MKREIKFFNEIFENLTPKTQEIIEIAKSSMEKAYAPYSKFKVGAAVLLENGEIITGNNQENAAYPSGLCAERVAVFSAKALCPEDKILKIAIFTNREKDDSAVAPCGACRQSILEYEVQQNQPIEIIFQGEKNKFIRVESTGDLLPFHFDSSRLI